MGQYGMTTTRHDAIDKSSLHRYYERVYERLASFNGKVVVDAFSGGGRDIIEFYKRLNGDAEFIAIDSDPQKIVDMLAKNADNQDLRDHETCIELAVNREDVHRIASNQWIAAIQGRFPDRPLGNHAEKSDIDLKADFMLCNAGIMFIKPEDIKATLGAMADMVAPGGELALRFSQARDDKAEALGKSYFIYDPEMVQAVLEENGMITKRHSDLDDPDERPFKWVDIQALKPL